jgi:hypothetical protein
MNGYTVTVTPSDGRPGPQTTIHVDTIDGVTRVTELTVRGNGNGLSTQELPVIDVAGLLAALTPAATTAPAAPGTPAARTPRDRRTRTTAAAKPVPAKATRGRRRTAGKADPPKAGRAYRRMPDQDEVVAAWRASRSASAVAAHFAVPRHTATGWLRRLRAMCIVKPTS